MLMGTFKEIFAAYEDSVRNLVARLYVSTSSLRLARRELASILQANDVAAKHLIDRFAKLTQSRARRK